MVSIILIVASVILLLLTVIVAYFLNNVGVDDNPNGRRYFNAIPDQGDKHILLKETRQPTFTENGMIVYARPLDARVEGGFFGLRNSEVFKELRINVAKGREIKLDAICGGVPVSILAPMTSEEIPDALRASPFGQLMELIVHGERGSESRVSTLSDSVRALQDTNRLVAGVAVDRTAFEKLREMGLQRPVEKVESKIVQPRVGSGDVK